MYDGFDALTKDQQQKAQLLGSYLNFLRTFFELKTGKPFALSHPNSRESHFITIAKALKRVYLGECKRLIINVPPRYGKTTMMIYFVAWAMARYPDSNFLYLSYSQSLSAMQTQAIRDIISMPIYRELFGVTVSNDTSAKDDFSVIDSNGGGHGRVFAAGAGGPITGRGAGVKNTQRFSGCIILDDVHKPKEVESDVMRQAVNDWYFNTVQSRVNDAQNTPIIGIGQALNEDDLFMNLRKLRNEDGNLIWEVVSLPALDEVGNALYPEMHTEAMLRQMERESPYVFAAQMQQNPQPAGGGIFKPEWFVKLDKEPDIISTFITADTACSANSYSDATVFSFFGVYKIKIRDVETGGYGLHWLDCVEIRCEPKDLENEFYAFYMNCMRHKVQPKKAAIEKASTGITLISVLQKMRSLQIYPIEHTKATGSKISRFLDAQPYVGAGDISFTNGAKHVDMCIEHMRKITANNSHRHDDIADTLQMAIQCALIDKVFLPPKEDDNDIALLLAQDNMNIQSLRMRAMQ